MASLVQSLTDEPSYIDSFDILFSVGRIYYLLYLN